MEFFCVKKITTFYPETKTWSYEWRFTADRRTEYGGIEPLTLTDVTDEPDSYTVGATYVLCKKMKEEIEAEEAKPGKVHLLTKEELKDYLEEPASTRYCWWCKNQGVDQCPHHGREMSDTV